MHCQATRTSTAASTGPKRRVKRLRPIAAEQPDHGQRQPEHDHRQAVALGRRRFAREERPCDQQRGHAREQPPAETVHGGSLGIDRLSECFSVTWHKRKILNPNIEIRNKQETRNTNDQNAQETTF